MLLIFHLVLLLGPFGWDSNFRLSAIFVTSALWWWGFGYLMFKWTPEPEIPSSMEWEGVVSAAKVAYGQVFTTFKEIKRFKILAMYLLAYLLFYDGVNTIASMASAYGDSVLRLSLQLNIYLLLTVNIVAIPMTLLFGKLANAKGTKFALMLSLVIYCCVAVVAAGFAPLELDPTVDDKGVAEDQNVTISPLPGMKQPKCTNLPHFTTRDTKVGSAKKAPVTMISVMHTNNTSQNLIIPQNPQPVRLEPVFSCVLLFLLSLGHLVQESSTSRTSKWAGRGHCSLSSLSALVS